MFPKRSIRRYTFVKRNNEIHQVLSKKSLGILEFRNLSYFDDEPHSKIGTLNYAVTKSSKTWLIYYEVYSDEESLSEPDTNEKSLEPI